MTLGIAKTVAKAIKANNVELIKKLAKSARVSPGKLMSQAKAYLKRGSKGKKRFIKEDVYKAKKDFDRDEKKRLTKELQKKWTGLK